jgi:hypothetical protein
MSKREIIPEAGQWEQRLVKVLWVVLPILFSWYAWNHEQVDGLVIFLFPLALAVWGLAGLVCIVLSAVFSNR